MTEPDPACGHSQSALLLYAGSAHQDFFAGVVLGARNLGFEHCGYLIGIPLAKANWNFVMASNLPRAWQERYLRRGYHEIDPTVQYAKTAVAPLVWSRDSFVSRRTNRWLKDALAIGFNHGWTQPMRDASGRFGMLTLARGEGAIGTEELEEKQPMLQWLAQVVHRRLFGEFQAWQRNESIRRLTERELVCLRLAADGATSGEIADVTGVGERTVNFHVANAISKLGALNKTHAVALALRLGLLA